MLKKIMLYLMMLETVVKFLSLTFLFSTNIEHLPVAVYISTGVVILFGIGLICKNIISSIATKELAGYYAVMSMSVILNVIFMKIFSRAELGLLDFTVIGTLLDVVISCILILLTVRESKYVRIRVKNDI